VHIISHSLGEPYFGATAIIFQRNQSINQSLFQAEAHKTTNNKENANTGNRTEQTHRRIQVKKSKIK